MVGVPEPVELSLSATRVAIRLLRSEDQPLYSRLYTDEKLLRYIMPPLSQAQAIKSFQNALALNSTRIWSRLFFVVEDKLSMQTMGLVGLSSADWTTRSLEFGIVLQHDAQGQGIASEILQAWLPQLFRTFSMRTVWLEVQRGNSAAVAMARRANMKRMSGIEAGDKQIWYKSSQQ
ncbi:GNAT family N-acetyltransferase [Alkalimonas mucilaginosa]|uniref:GNAT family N-acetyltransferase n=1 Tax=Alkalimonas mucilaginosa TaxID=3057676 RepID=A0ABU7JDK5_9GAMM|nr:GNAT family N-acetyltransferase [Alkalimonas sp. MEB004]MEE2023779.1 GNAT family N-acetyltransferase [Alkalimonas sp. MEB004]